MTEYDLDQYIEDKRVVDTLDEVPLLSVSPNATSIRKRMFNRLFKIELLFSFEEPIQTLPSRGEIANLLLAKYSGASNRIALNKDAMEEKLQQVTPVIEIRQPKKLEYSFLLNEVPDGMEILLRKGEVLV